MNTTFSSVADLQHGNFNAIESDIPALFGIEEVVPWSLGGTKAIDGYEALCNLTVSLLNLSVNNLSEGEVRKTVSNNNGITYRLYPSNQ